jgi:hypothetical protein
MLVVSVSSEKCPVCNVLEEQHIRLRSAVNEFHLASSSKTLVPSYQTTRRHFPENSNLHINRLENVKPHILLCRIWGSHTGGYEEYHLLGYKAV